MLSFAQSVDVTGKTVWITLMLVISTTIRRDIAILEMGSNHSGMDVVATPEVRAYGIGRISPSPRMTAIPQDPKATRVAKGEARQAPYHASLNHLLFPNGALVRAMWHGPCHLVECSCVVVVVVVGVV